MIKLTASEKKRFEEKFKINQETGCWEWTASTTKGYGTIKIRGAKKSAHRISYELYVGPIGSLQVCHKCDNPICVNPKHLFLGTQKDNIHDMIAKGRDNFGTNLKSMNQEGNNKAGKKVMAEGIVYGSYSEAGRALGVSDNAIRKRIKKGLDGYKKL
jgi:hypothetical protein